MINRCDRVGSIGYMSEFPDFNIPKFEIQKYNQRFHDANVIIDASATRIHYPEHWGGLSIKCAFNGSEYYQTKKTLYQVNASSYLIFNEGNLYSSWIDDVSPVQSFTLNMTPAFEQQATTALFCSQTAMIDDPARLPNKRIHFLECLYSHGGEMTQLMFQMRDLSKDLAINSLKLEELFFELFVAMHRRQHREHFISNELSQPARHEVYQRLLRARDFMMSCYCRDLHLSDIAEISCMNKFHFLRQFKHFFGQTPHQFLTSVRIDAARRKIEHSSDTVDQVCYDVGYSDISSFSKLFKKQTGYSPASYRAITT